MHAIGSAIGSCGCMEREAVNVGGAATRLNSTEYSGGAPPGVFF